MSKVWHIWHQNPHLQGQGMQWWHQKCPRMNALQDSHRQHAENSSSKPGKPPLSWMPVSTLSNFTASNDECTFSGHTAVGNSDHWLHMSTFPPVEDTLPRIPQGSSKSGKTVRLWMPVHILTTCTWSSRNTDFSEPNTVTPSAVVLTDFIWTPFHPWKLIYQIQKAPQHLENKFCH